MATTDRPARDAPRSRLDSSSILDFGRYAGWSLAQIVEKDPDYLEWLVRTRSDAGWRPSESAPRVPGSVRSPVGVGVVARKAEVHW